MAGQDMADKLTMSLSGLRLSTSNLSTSSHRPAPSKAAAKAPVADSWEDEGEDDTDQAIDEGDDLSELPAAKHKRNPSDYPNAPPPTPAVLSPSLSQANDASIDSAFAPTRSSTSIKSRHTETRDPDKRPEKSTAVASRLIAAGLGVKAPRRTEEQRQYDKSVREQERKKKEREIQERKREEEEKEKAKRSVWED